MSDNVSNPSHYKHDGCRECIDVIRDVTGSAYDGYLLGNIVKYLYRYRDKNGVEDLKKARQYLDWLIEGEEELAVDVDDGLIDISDGTKVYEKSSRPKHGGPRKSREEIRYIPNPCQ